MLTLRSPIVIIVIFITINEINPEEFVNVYGL